MCRFRIVLLLMIHSVLLTASAQSVDVFKTPSLTFFGLDFSQAKLIGYGAINRDMIKERMVEQWNMLLASEQSKFNIKKAFDKKEVIYDIKRVKKINDHIDSIALFPDSNYVLKLIQPNEINAHVNQLETEGYKGLGLLFVVDYFSRENATGDIVIVFFDIENKKVLLQKRMSGSPAGVTYRNYWAGAIHEIIENAERAYNRWQIEKK